MRAPSPGVPPTAPSISLGTATSSTQPITISGGSGASLWLLQYAPASSGSWATFSTPSPASTSETITGLSASTSYDYRIVASNSYGTVNSNTATGSTASGGSAFDFYIGTSGSDSNDGLTTSTPWAITALNTKRATYTGKTVGLMDGTYDVSSLMPQGGSTYYTAALEVDGGTFSASTTIKAVNARLAILDAKGASGQYGGGTTTQASIMRHGNTMTHQGYLVIDGIKFINYKTGAMQIGTYASSSNLQGVIVRNCEFTGQNGGSNGAGLDNNYTIEINQGDGIQVINNYFHDNAGYTSNSADHLSAVLAWACKNTVIEYNTVVNSSNIYGKELGNQGTTIRYNHIDCTNFTSNGSNGFGDWTGYNTSGLTIRSSFHHNIVIANQSGANLGNTLGGNGGWSTGLDFYSNTVVLVDTGQILQQHFGAWFPSTNNSALNFYNNLFTGAISPDRKMISVNALAWAKCAYNLYPSSGTRWRILQAASSSFDNTDGDYSNIATYRTAIQTAGGLSTSLMELGTVESSQALSSLFIQTGSNADYYKLKTGSNALSAGKSDGTSGGTTCDIGAWDGTVTQIGFA